MREKKKTPAQNIRPFFHGIVADLAMRRWLEADEQIPGQMVAWVPDVVQQCLDNAKAKGKGVVRWKSPTDRAEMTEWVVQLLTRLEPFLLRDVVPYEFQPEYRFRVPIRIPDLTGEMAEIDLVGGMDIVVREMQGPPEVWAGYDLKATENPDYLRKTLGQSVFYSLAHLAERGVPFRTFAFIQPMVETNPVAYVEITESELRAMMARIVKMAHDIWRGDVGPKPDNDGCSWCFVKHGCAKFKPSPKSAIKLKHGSRPAA